MLSSLVSLVHFCLTWCCPTYRMHSIPVWFFFFISCTWLRSLVTICPRYTYLSTSSIFFPSTITSSTGIPYSSNWVGIHIPFFLLQPRKLDSRRLEVPMETSGVCNIWVSCLTWTWLPVLNFLGILILAWRDPKTLCKTPGKPSVKLLLLLSV